MNSSADLAPTQQLAPHWLGAAPHRLLFFVGACNLLLAMAVWAGWLVLQRWPLFAPPVPAIAPGWLHAFVMQYQVLPSFMFGFLLTVFPRWLALPDLARWRYLLVGLGLMGTPTLLPKAPIKVINCPGGIKDRIVANAIGLGCWTI